MRDLNTLNKYRKKHPVFNLGGDNKNGYFLIPYEHYNLNVIASNGMDFDHVSVSINGNKNKLPTWKMLTPC